MDEIEKRTDGRWRPSPGSIYPLLAWLQDNRYVKELPTDESGMKRYELTENGKSFLEEQRKIKMEFGKEPRLFGPPFLGPFWFHVPPEKTFEVRESMRKFVTAFFELGGSLEKRFSEEALGDVKKVLDETTEDIEEINKKLKAKKYD
jgi:DNA-binding PadR family transcriptional regulator